jgi:hypothetical protein
MFARRQTLIVIHVDFSLLPCPIFPGDFIQDRRNHFARAAPFGKSTRTGCPLWSLPRQNLIRRL